MTHERQELIWVAAGQTLTLGIGFLSIKILTNMMGATAYGQLMLGVSLAALVSLFIYGPLGQAAIRFYSICRERGELVSYARAFRNIHTRVLFALLIPAFALAVVFNHFLGGVWPYLVAIAVLYSVVTGINHGFLSMFSGMRRRAVVAMHQGAESAARLLGAVVVMLIVGISPDAALFGYASGSLLILGLLFRVASTTGQFGGGRLRRSPTLSVSSAAAMTRIYEEVWQYVLPFLVWAAIGFAFIHGDRWMLQSVRGAEAVGTYVAIYQIGSALPNAIVSIVSQYIEPLVFERAEVRSADESARDGRALIRIAVLYTGLLVLGMVVVAATWSMEIVDLVTTPEFSRHSGLLAWIVAGTGIIGLGQILTIQGLAMRQPSAYISSKTIAAIALLGTAYFGATRYGAEGVAKALVVAGFVYLLSVVYVNARLVRHDSH